MKSSDKVSKTLTSRRLLGATTFAGSKKISVLVDNGKTYYVDKTPTNLKYIRSRLGKGEMEKYRGKNRIIWF